MKSKNKTQDTPSSVEVPGSALKIQIIKDLSSDTMSVFRPASKRRARLDAIPQESIQ